MFTPIDGESRISQVAPLLVIFAVIAVFVVLLIELNVLPGETLWLVFGPGFLLALLVVPTGVHGNAGLFLLIGGLGTVLWWWLVVRIARWTMHTLAQVRGAQRE